MRMGGAKGRRIDWVDALRALAMFFVILGHHLNDVTGYFVFTSPIKIPLFFMITGCVFNYGRTRIGGFFKSLFFKLIVPWLCLTVPFVLIRAIVSGPSIIPQGLYNIVSGTEAWYMPCLAVAEIIWFFICKLGKKPLPISIAAAAVCVLGVLAGRRGILDFAMISRAMTAQLFILMGYLFKTHEERIERIGWAPLAALAAVYIGMGFVSLKVWPESCIDVHLNSYYSYPFCLAVILIGCFTVFAAAKKLCEREGVKVPRLICFLGQTTLVYYLLNPYNGLILTKALAMLHIELPRALDIAAHMIFTYVACGVEAALILRFCPWVLGRKKKRE